MLSFMRALMTIICFSCVVSLANAASDPIPPTDPVVVPSTFTFEQRANLYLHDTYGPFSILSSAFTAGIRQAQDQIPEWGQGASGYGRRFSSSFGKKVIENSIQFGLGYALHEDSRFFVSNRSGIGDRTFYAFSHTFLSRKDSGKFGLSYSYISGIAGGVYVSRQWYPAKDRSASEYISGAVMSMGVDAAINIMKEFWPDLKKKLFR
jgi:hypothetical protein